MFNYKYINDKYEKEIHTWKYRGGSDSILYEYVWSPLTNCLVERVIPDYIAPNTVTLIGFIGLIIAHIITAYFCYDFNQTAPAWVIKKIIILTQIYFKGVVHELCSYS